MYAHKINFSDKKELIFDGIFSKVDAIFWHFKYYNTMIFSNLFKTAFETFLAQ